MTDEGELLQKESAVGTFVVAVSAQALLTVAEALHDTAPDVANLKIMSGEHIAAIVVSTLFGVPPRAVDVDGGVDLEYDLRNRSTHGFLNDRDLVAVEVKSLPGPSRDTHARIERLERRGQDPTGESVRVVVESAATILPDVVAAANKSAAAMRTKLPADVERHAFVLIHPFDRFAVETYENHILSPALPQPEKLDSSIAQLWVLWVPDQLTVWSTADRLWREIIFGAEDLEANREAESLPVGSSLALLQEAESRFLRHAGSAGSSSPYLFNLTAR